MASPPSYVKSKLWDRDALPESRRLQVLRVLEKKRVANKLSENLINVVWYEIRPYVELDVSKEEMDTYKSEATAKFIEILKVRLPMQKEGGTDKDYPERVKTFLESENGKSWMESWFQPKAVPFPVATVSSLPPSPTTTTYVEPIAQPDSSGIANAIPIQSSTIDTSLPHSTSASLPAASPSQPAFEDQHALLIHQRSVQNGVICPVHGPLCSNAGQVTFPRAGRNWKKGFLWSAAPASLSVLFFILLSWLFPDVQIKVQRR